MRGLYPRRQTPHPARRRCAPPIHLLPPNSGLPELGISIRRSRINPTSMGEGKKTLPRPERGRPEQILLLVRRGAPVGRGCADMAAEFRVFPVEISADGGRTWSPGVLKPPLSNLTWVTWTASLTVQFELNATVGTATAFAGAIAVVAAVTGAATVAGVAAAGVAGGLPRLSGGAAVGAGGHRFPAAHPHGLAAVSCGVHRRAHCVRGTRARHDPKPTPCKRPCKAVGQLMHNR